MKFMEYRSVILGNGRIVGAEYDPASKDVVINFSRRITPELMGEYRSVSELNSACGTNFGLSKNKRCLITSADMTRDAALGLIACLSALAEDTENFSS